MGGVARSVLIKGIADFCTRVLSFITFPVMARYLGADGYGAYSQLVSIVGFIAPFASLGIPGSMVRYFAGARWDGLTKKRFSYLFCIVAGSGGFCCLLLCLFSGLLNSMFLRWVHGRELFVVGSFLVITSALDNLLNEILRSQLWIVQLSAAVLFKSLLIAILSIYLLMSGNSLVVVITATVVISFVCLLFNFSIVMFRGVNNRCVADDAAPLNFIEIVLYGISLTIAGMGLSLMHVGNRFVLGYFVDIGEIGLYGFCYNFALLLVSVGAPLLWPVYPCLVKHLQSHDARGAAEAIKEYHKYMTLILVPAAFYFAVNMNNIGALLGGDGFVGSIFVPIFVVAAIFFDQWNGLAHYVLAAKDKVVFLRNVWLLLGVANFLLSLLFVPYYGVLGAAFVSFITFFSLEIIVWFKANKLVDLLVSYRFDLLLPVVFFSIVAFLVDRFFFSFLLNSKLGLLFFSALYMFFYFCILIVTRNFSLKDARRIFNK